MADQRVKPTKVDFEALRQTITRLEGSERSTDHALASITRVFLAVITEQATKIQNLERQVAHLRASHLHLG